MITLIKNKTYLFLVLLALHIIISPLVFIFTKDFYERSFLQESINAFKNSQEIKTRYNSKPVKYLSNLLSVDTSGYTIFKYPLMAVNVISSEKITPKMYASIKQMGMQILSSDQIQGTVETVGSLQFFKIEKYYHNPYFYYLVLSLNSVQSDTVKQITYRKPISCKNICLSFWGYCYKPSQLYSYKDIKLQMRTDLQNY